MLAGRGGIALTHRARPLWTYVGSHRPIALKI